MTDRSSRNKAISFLIWLALFLVPLIGAAEYAPFAVVTDTHIGAPSSAYPAFIRAVEEEKIEVIIHTGDAINRPGSVSQWEKFFEITGPGKRLHLAPGNHDIHGNDSLAVYLEFFPYPYYAFSDGDTLFVLLNTELPGQETRVVGDQFEWLKAELERPFRYKFVFLHKPLFPVMPYHGLDRQREARDALHHLFVQTGVSLVVAGHDHLYDRNEREGITYVVAGRAGGLLPWPSTNGNSFRYIIVKRTGDSYTFTVRDMLRNVKDEFSVTRAPVESPKEAGDLQKETIGADAQ